jgi:translation initiation factor IF-2
MPTDSEKKAKPATPKARKPAATKTEAAPAVASEEAKPAAAKKPRVTKPKAKVTTPESEAPAPAPSAAVEAPAPVKTPEPTPAAAPVATEPAPAAEAASGETPVDDSKVITMKPPIVVKELAARIGLKPFQVVHELMEMNIFATLNQTIDEEVAKQVCTRKGFDFQLEKRKTGEGFHKPVEVKPEPPVQPPVVEENLVTRPPVITIMGHVDHGKTSLLDAIRQTQVAAGEAGGITQHIGAYTVKYNGQAITFLDTPGHEAFTAMRARGTSVTDIAVIVVAADDGLMPTTLEAINHARAAKVSLMVAINKIDMPGANVDRVKGQLQEKGLTPEDWGGDTICCEVSATKKIGIQKLLEMMLLQAEVLELKAEMKGLARGIVIEAQIDVGRGPNATVIVQHGTLRVGDAFICGNYHGTVKALIDDKGQNIKEAGPSIPVRILGFNGAPIPGDPLLVMKSDKEVRRIADERVEAERLNKLTRKPGVTLENLFSSIADDAKKTLPLIMKSDVQGSMEAIVDALKKLPSNKVTIEFILTGVGPISVNDVLLAKASNAVIIGFNTKTDNAAASAAKREDVQIKLFSIIYELIDQVKEAMTGLLDPETRESQIGTALVKKVFDLSKFPVAGCLVESGRISRTGRARVLRKKQPIYDGGVQTLKRFQDDVNEVRAGMECGIRLGNFDEYEEGDIIECYVLEKVAQVL